MLGGAGKRGAFSPTFADRGQHDTTPLADAMGVGTVCTMSGLPAGRSGDELPNWAVSSRPPEAQAILCYHWENVLIPFWQETVALAKENSVRIALELHGDQCVYNVPALLRLRDAIGPVIGATSILRTCTGWARTRSRRSRLWASPSTMFMPRTRC